LDRDYTFETDGYAFVSRPVRRITSETSRVLLSLVGASAVLALALLLLAVNAVAAYRTSASSDAWTVGN